MKWKLSSLILVLGLGPSVVFAASAVSSIPDDVTIVLPSNSTKYIISKNGVFDVLTINDASFSFDLAADSVVEITSADKKNLTNTLNLATVCQADNSYLKLKLDPGTTATTTVTVTPSGSCTGSGGGGSIGSGSGGGGGGGGGSAPAAAPASTPAPSASVTIPSGTPATPVAIPAKDLKSGDRNSDVRKLQELLKKDPSIYPEGVVNGNFGRATAAAVKRFQKKYGLPAVGRVGPLTREKLSEVFGGEVVPPGTPPEALANPSGVVPLNLSRGFAIGARGEDVRSLQAYLAKDPALYPEGIVSGRFGTLTKAAVERFQEKYGLSLKGELGYGQVGPKTRAKLLELTGGK